jgi:hypothetical protein
VIEGVEEVLRRKREFFIALVHQTGTVPTGPLKTAEFNRTIDKVFLISPEQANNCISPFTAKFLYDRAKALVGTATRLEATTRGIDLDGLLPGVFSNKANLELVIKDGIPHVFKVAIDPQFQGSIDMDIQASTNLVGIPGLVSYERFSIPKSTGGEYVGSLSKFYARSLP